MCLVCMLHVMLGLRSFKKHYSVIREHDVVVVQLILSELYSVTAKVSMGGNGII